MRRWSTYCFWLVWPFLSPGNASIHQLVIFVSLDFPEDMCLTFEMNNLKKQRNVGFSIRGEIKSEIDIFLKLFSLRKHHIIKHPPSRQTTTSLTKESVWTPESRNLLLPDQNSYLIFCGYRRLVVPLRIRSLSRCLQIFVGLISCCPVHIS